MACVAIRVAVIAALLGVAGPASAQSAANLRALDGLAPASALANTPAGQAALAANYAVTGEIQRGVLAQPILLPFPQQQRLALKDAFITIANASELADGLGSRLGAAYQSLARYDGPKAFTSVSPAVEALFAYSISAVGSDSNFAKNFFANRTLDGTAKASAAADSVFAGRAGHADMFGTAYGMVPGRGGARTNGNPRPFQTHKEVAPIAGVDFFGAPSTNADYLSGPAQDLRESPSFPSFHTTYGYTEAVLLGILVPERYGQEITRAAEYGNHRILLGAHYAMDVVAGRTLALHDLAHLLANDPAYVAQPVRSGSVIADYPALLAVARADIAVALPSACGEALPACAAEDRSRFSNPAANEAFYDATQTYGLPVVYQSIAAITEDVATVAPEAGHLLTAAFPYLTLAQADAILTETEGPGGGFLDDGSAFGLYSRLNLYAAVKRAVAAAPIR